MADLTQHSPSLPSLWKRVDKAWLAILLIPLLLLIFDPPQTWPTVVFAANGQHRSNEGDDFAGTEG